MMSSAQEILQTVFGYEQFRPGQAQVIQQALNRQNTLAVMPTGGGKSLCYQIPALLKPGVTLVVSPLLALMKDQVDALRQNGIPAAAINSTIPKEAVNPILRQAYEGKLKLLYVTPERLAMEFFQYQLTFLPIDLIAIDEAHCISQWGHDFRPAYRQLQAAIEKLPTHPTVLALTATATPPVRQDIGEQLAIPAANFVITSFTRDNLAFKVVHPQVPDRQYIVQYLQAPPAMGAGLLGLSLMMIVGLLRSLVLNIILVAYLIILKWLEFLIWLKLLMVIGMESILKE